MQLTLEECKMIVEKSRSLFERLEGGIVQNSTTNPKQEKLVDARLRKWCDTSAEGDMELFKKRLAYEGLDLDSARQILGCGTSSSSQDPPSWTNILNEVLQQAEDFPGESLKGELSEQYPFFKKEFPVPFEEVFLPCILVARKRVATEVGNQHTMLTKNAQTSLERFLLQRLSAISSRVLEVEFSTFRACLQFSGMAYSEVVKNHGSRKQYVSFVKEMVTDGLRPLFKEYCVWARRLATRIDQWVNLVNEFLVRLHTDLPDIQQHFSEGKELGKVVEIEPGLSDSHYDGRTVMILNFESGTKVVYKPKNMGLEADYFQLVDWFEQAGSCSLFQGAEGD